MTQPNNQILTVEQMQAAEQDLIDGGTSVDQLMQVAGGGAAEWVWRVAAGRDVTVLCGPGNNGGDGYVIAETLRKRGLTVNVVAPKPPTTSAAKKARKALELPVATSGKDARGSVFVDCLFGSGLSRPLSPELSLLLRDLVDRHEYLVAVDLPSGISSDDGKPLNDRLPIYDLTLALGAWKFAHFLAPSSASMGARRLIDIGVGTVDDAAQLLPPPDFAQPGPSTHKYSRGFCAVIAGEMPGASLLACTAAMHSGAGYVKLLADSEVHAVPHDLVVAKGALEDELADDRIDSVLVGPGLGRSEQAGERLARALASGRNLVLDADALALLRPRMLHERHVAIATPHEGELDRLCRSFGIVAGSRLDKARLLAETSGMVVVAKGAATFVAAPDGRRVVSNSGSSWLSVAGTGDVLAGITVGRLATGLDPFDAACEAVWLHSKASRLAVPPFTASALAGKVAAAYAACL